MALETFAPPVSPSSVSDSPEVRVLRSDFGDGYSQTTVDGINNIKSVCSVTWEVLTASQFAAILGFIQQHKGATPFLYAFYGDAEPRKWTVSKWTTATVSGGYHRIDAEFRQSFSFA